MNQPGGRLIELDVLRGFLLLWMTLTHLPTQVSIVSNQTFGFVSGAEGFIFLSAFLVGQIESRKGRHEGEIGVVRDVAQRTCRLYLYHVALLALAFAVFAPVAVTFHRLAVENLLSYFLQSPSQAIPAAALLLYRPSLFDILPMYIVFLMLTPFARALARRWSWKLVLSLSLGLWAGAQCGLRHFLFTKLHLFGLAVPENSTGAFDLYAWQLLWLAGLAWGTRDADSRSRSADSGLPAAARMSGWLRPLSVMLAIAFLLWRYSPAETWPSPQAYGWLLDKWHLGPARVINFSALTLVLVRFGDRLAALPLLRPLSLLGQASIEVFCVHILCCVSGDLLSREADPHLPWWQQALLLVITIVALFLTALARRKWASTRKNLPRQAA